MIKASEQAGNLELGLRQAASYLERQASTAQKIKRAMFYPAFVLLMAIGVTILLITVALPPLVDLFTAMDVELPWMTQLLISGTSFILDNMSYILAVIILLVTIAIGILRLPSVRLAKDELILKIPLIGAINIERGVQHFCQTASMLLKAGLHLPQIMDIAIQTNKNQIIRQSLNDVKDRLVQGEGLAQPLADIELFPQLLSEMVVVGEKTGAMDSTLATLADYYEQRVDRRIELITSMIEPLLTLVIGVVIIFIALSMITPLYTILRSMG